MNNREVEEIEQAALQLRKARTSLKRMQDDLRKTQAELTAMNTELTSYKTQLASSNSENLSLKAQESTRRLELVAIRQEHAACKGEISRYREEISRLCGELIEVEERRRRAGEDFKTKEGELRADLSKLKVLLNQKTSFNIADAHPYGQSIDSGVTMQIMKSVAAALDGFKVPENLRNWLSALRNVLRTGGSDSLEKFQCECANVSSVEDREKIPSASFRISPVKPNARFAELPVVDRDGQPVELRENQQEFFVHSRSPPRHTEIIVSPTHTLSYRVEGPGDPSRAVRREVTAQPAAAPRLTPSNNNIRAEISRSFYTHPAPVSPASRLAARKAASGLERKNAFLTAQVKDLQSQLERVTVQLRSQAKLDVQNRARTPQEAVERSAIGLQAEPADLAMPRVLAVPRTTPIPSPSISASVDDRMQLVRRNLHESEEFPEGVGQTREDNVRIVPQNQQNMRRSVEQFLSSIVDDTSPTRRSIGAHGSGVRITAQL